MSLPARVFLGLMVALGCRATSSSIPVSDPAPVTAPAIPDVLRLPSEAGDPDPLTSEDPIGVVWAADGRRVALAARHTVEVFDATDGRRLLRVSVPCVAELSLAPDGRWLAVGSSSLDSYCAFDSYGTLHTMAWDLDGPSPTPRDVGFGQPRVGPHDLLALATDEGARVVDLRSRELLALLDDPPQTMDDDRLVDALGRWCEGWDHAHERYFLVRNGHLLTLYRGADGWQATAVPVTLPPAAGHYLKRDHFFGESPHEARCWVDKGGQLVRGTVDTLWRIHDDGHIEWPLPDVARRLGVVQDDAPGWLLVFHGPAEAPPLRWRSPHGTAEVLTAFSPDARRLVTYGTDHQAFVWRFEALHDALRRSASVLGNEGR